MKNIALFLIILQIFSCVSTKHVAESRNSDVAAQNNFEIYRFWRELDILRFNNGLLNVRILLIPEGINANAFESDSQMIHIYDSLMVMIGDKIKGFQELKKIYNDTTDQGRLNIYNSLKSDSTDQEFLKKIAASSYFELYEDIILRYRESIQASKFYSSFREFDSYIRNRSFEIVDKHLYEEIYGSDIMSMGELSKNQIKKLKEDQIDFIIFFSGSYNIDYSERARSRLGSESIHLKLIDMRTAETVTTANIIQYWGNE
jgi:hypothetical protein